MNSTKAALDRFHEHYGEVNLKTLEKFFGVKDDAIYTIKRFMQEEKSGKKGKKS